MKSLIIMDNFQTQDNLTEFGLGYVTPLIHKIMNTVFPNADSDTYCQVHDINIVQCFDFFTEGIINEINPVISIGLISTKPITEYTENISTIAKWLGYTLEQVKELPSMNKSYIQRIDSETGEVKKLPFIATHLILGLPTVVKDNIFDMVRCKPFSNDNCVRNINAIFMN